MKIPGKQGTKRLSSTSDPSVEALSRAVDAIASLRTRVEGSPLRRGWLHAARMRSALELVRAEDRPAEEADLWDRLTHCGSGWRDFGGGAARAEEVMSFLRALSDLRSSVRDVAHVRALAMAFHRQRWAGVERLLRFSGDNTGCRRRRLAASLLLRGLPPLPHLVPPPQRTISFAHIVRHVGHEAKQELERFDAFSRDRARAIAIVEGAQKRRRRSDGAIFSVLDVAFCEPVFRPAAWFRPLGVSLVRLGQILSELEELGIVRELSGRRTHRVWSVHVSRRRGAAEDRVTPATVSSPIGSRSLAVSTASMPDFDWDAAYSELAAVSERVDRTLERYG